MGKIFISYRRDDSLSITDRLYDDLSQHIGERNIFRDLTGISMGEDFRHRILDALEDSQILLVIIGREWRRILDERAESDERDWVAFEVETGLARMERGKIAVIPILVEGATAKDQLGNLPPALTRLGPLHAGQLRPGKDYKRDLEELLANIDRILQVRADRIVNRPLSSPQPAEAPPAEVETGVEISSAVRLTSQPKPNSPAPELEPATSSPARRGFQFDWRFWVPSILIPLIGLILALVPLLQNQGTNGPDDLPELNMSLYYGEANSLTLVANDNVFLSDIALVTPKNRNLPAELASDFAAYLSIPADILQAGGCLQYQRANVEAAQPRACNNAPVSGLVITTDPFWYDEATGAMLPVQIIYEGQHLLKECLPEDGRCDIND